MIAALVFASAAQQPKDFNALELASIQAYHDATHLHEVWKVTVKEGSDPDQEIIRETDIDGAKDRVMITVNGEKAAEAICDGKTATVIVFSTKSYMTQKVADSAPFKAEDEMLKPEKETLTYKFDSMGAVRFAADPQFTITSFDKVKDGDDDAWKVESKAKSARGNTAALSEWFATDRWFLKRFKLSVQTADTSATLSGEVTDLRFRSVLPDTEYILDPALIQGFTKTDGGGR